MNIQDHRSDDALNVAPQLHSVLYEDNKMRILKVSVNPGERAEMHWHPHNANYVIKAGKLRFTAKNDTTTEIELTEGQVTSTVNEVFHAVDNIGDTTVETIQIELKY